MMFSRFYANKDDPSTDDLLASLDELLAPMSLGDTDIDRELAQLTEDGLNIIRMLLKMQLVRDPANADRIQKAIASIDWRRPVKTASPS